MPPPEVRKYLFDIAEACELLTRFSSRPRIMDYHVVEARYVAGHVLWLRFRDGTIGEIDLALALRGPVFEPLRDPAVFRQFQIHPEFHTLVWPNGADFAPEFLRDNVRVSV